MKTNKQPAATVVLISTSPAQFIQPSLYGTAYRHDLRRPASRLIHGELKIRFIARISGIQNAFTDLFLTPASKKCTDLCVCSASASRFNADIQRIIVDRVLTITGANARWASLIPHCFPAGQTGRLPQCSAAVCNWRQTLYWQSLCKLTGQCGGRFCSR